MVIAAFVRFDYCAIVPLLQIRGIKDKLSDAYYVVLATVYDRIGGAAVSYDAAMGDQCKAATSPILYSGMLVVDHQPPIANRQQPLTANRHPPPTAANCQPPTQHQPPTTNHQPPTANRQPPTATNRQPLFDTVIVISPCLDHEAESVPVNTRFCWRYKPFWFFPTLKDSTEPRAICLERQRSTDE